MYQKGFINIILVIIVVALVGAGAYSVSTRRITSPIPSPTPSNTPTPSPTLTPTPTLSPTSKPTPISSPNLSVFHNVKYFYDTTPFPKEGEPLSGYKDEVSIRGKLIATKVQVRCVVAPCPEPNPPQFTFSLQDISNKNYQINIRSVDNPIVKNLRIGDIYVIRGILEHGFDYRNQVVFIFDPERVY